MSFIVLLLIFINWFGKKPIFARIPTGLLLLIAGTALAWISGLQSPEAIKASMSSFGFNPPEVHVDSFMQGLAARAAVSGFGSAFGTRELHL